MNKDQVMENADSVVVRNWYMQVTAVCIQCLRKGFCQ